MKFELTGINKFYGDFHVLQDINLKAQGGRIFGFLGRNGAGKTTTIRIIMDVFKADSGSVTLNGEPFESREVRIGYLPEERGMYSKSSVEDQLIYFTMLRGLSRSEAEENVAYWGEKLGISEYMKRDLETLSKGNQQKVQITQAFTNNPDILILDEPFSGLDPVNSQVFQDALLEMVNDGKIVIFSSHQMSYVESFCDDIAIIDKGKIVLAGDLKEIKRERGLNKVILSFAEDKDRVNAFLSALNLDYKWQKDNVVCGLNGITKNELMQRVIDAGLNVTLFGNYAPSLQEIFVAEVGEHNESI